MPAPEPGPEWVLSGVNPRPDSATESELLKAARSAWPKALAHVRQVQSQNPFNDDGLLVAEVWEKRSAICFHDARSDEWKAG